jgi:hypothetical protein
MSTFLVTAVITFLVVSWARRNQRARQRWLARVNLPGHWSADVENGVTSIEFAGGLGEGSYRERAPAFEERGQWTLHGAHLTLTPERGSAVRYDFRRFEDGSIGIDGPGRQRRLYVRRQSNVVPLRGRR